MKAPFRERLKQGLIICDGAMGTLLELYGFNELPHEIYNVINPQIVESIHREYIQSGAEIIETNTSGANRLRLTQYHAQEKFKEINRQGVVIARRAAGNDVYVAGAIGPTGQLLEPIGKIKRRMAKEMFREQAEILLSEGIDLIILESFVSIDELDEALAAVKELTDLPVVAQKAFSEDAEILGGSFPREVVDHLIEKGADVVGANCSVGPQRMVNLIRSIYHRGLVVSAQPAAGIPTLFEGKAMYHATPEYLAVHAKDLVRSGTTIIGACCGSTPQHIKAIAHAVKGMEIGSSGERVVQSADKVVDEVEQRYYVAPSRWSKFSKNVNKKFLVAVELDIPRGVEMTSVLEGAQFCYERKIDAVNITDGARARLRMSPVAISLQVQQRTGIDVITHCTTRDRNLIGLQSDLLGAYALGLRNILCVTGDPTGIGDYPQASSVFDVDSVGLIRAVNAMNNGVDLMGNSIGTPTSFFIACAANPSATDFDKEIQKCERKAEAGAQMFFTQPLFEMATLEKFLNAIDHLRIPLMVGVIPLRSYRHGDFLHHEVPGMRIPEKIRNELRAAGDQAAAVGIKQAKEILHQAKQMVAGAYIMPPFRKYHVIDELLSVL